MKRIITPALLLFTAPAMAQVSMDPRALESLQAPPAASAPAQNATPAHRPPARHTTERRATGPAGAPATQPSAPGVPARTPQQAVSVAPAPPPVAVVPPPPVAVPVRPAPPPPVPVAVDAPGAATGLPDGLRLTFGTDRADLNPATEAALRTLARQVKGNEAETVRVAAYAAGNADDPSTPRRLSLSRALAVRALLINEGVVSTRIEVRALGASADPSEPAGHPPADRVDVTAAGPVAVQPAKAAP